MHYLTVLLFTYQHSCYHFQQPGYETGDVLIFLEESEHIVFKRKDTDLFMTLVQYLYRF